MANEERKISDLVISATAAMLEKLFENDHKGTFDAMGIDTLFHLMEDEVKELSDELCKMPLDATQLGKIRREAADVANFAAMIIYRCDKLIEE